MKRLCIFALITLVIVMVGYAQAQEKRDFFKIGVVTSLSGELALGGTLTKRGYDTWADAVNEEGGINIGGKKYKVQLIYADAQSAPATAAVAGERMITQEKVDFILGTFASGTTLSLAPITEKYKMPTITGSAESPLIWRRHFRYHFGTIPPIALGPRAPIHTLAQELTPKPKTIAILGIDDAYSKFGAEAFKAYSEKEGLQILKYEIVPEGSDYAPSLTAIKALNPDVIAMSTHEKAAIEMMKINKENKFNPKAFLQHYGVTTPDLQKGLGKDADYMFGLSYWTQNLKIQAPGRWKTPMQYADVARKRYNLTPDYTEAACTAAGLAFEEALKAIKATPPLTDAQKEALVDALEKVDLQTFYGRVKFATEGEFYHCNAGLEPVTVQLQNQKLVEVSPLNVATGKPIYPTPPWDKR